MHTNYISVKNVEIKTHVKINNIRICEGSPEIQSLVNLLKENFIANLTGKHRNKNHATVNSKIYTVFIIGYYGLSPLR